MIKFLRYSLLFFLFSSSVMGQEWLTSLEVAKRVALVQDKMIFMVWEGSALIPYPVLVNDANRNLVLIDNMFDHEEVNQIIWTYFIPLKVNESDYKELSEAFKNITDRNYKTQLEDDNIKILDANLHMVNTSLSPESYFNLSEFMNIYALNTSFLNAELKNYADHKDFASSFRLASKYMDYAILVNPKVRLDILKLAELYLNEAELYLTASDLANKSMFEQKAKLLRGTSFLIKNRPKKLLRQLKRISSQDVDDANKPMLAYLYYAAYQLRHDSQNAAKWKDQLSDLELRKVELILKLHAK